MKEENEEGVKQVDPYDDLLDNGRRTKRLKLGLSVLGSLAFAWFAFFLATGEALFGVKTIGLVLFIFTGTLVSYRPRKSLIKRYRR